MVSQYTRDILHGNGTCYTYVDTRAETGIPSDIPRSAVKFDVLPMATVGQPSEATGNQTSTEGLCCMGACALTGIHDAPQHKI